VSQNLIVISGLSHSGKDLILNQILKFGQTEPELHVERYIIYYDWLFKAFKKDETQYLEQILPILRKRILRKISTLVYVHDITYQRLDDTLTDFKEILSQIESHNKTFRVVLLLNRSHLIPNEVSSYIISLKGSDEQRMTNLIFNQIIVKNFDHAKHQSEIFANQILSLDSTKQRNIKKLLTEKMNEYGFAGAYLLSQENHILLAEGKTQSWAEKVGPQIIQVLAKEGGFDVTQGVKTNILRVEDFLMITQNVSYSMKLILIGREANFTLNNEKFSSIERKCTELASMVSSKL
jgi:hypothetical protein